jgi:hypothetical protein
MSRAYWTTRIEDEAKLYERLAGRPNDNPEQLQHFIDHAADLRRVLERLLERLPDKAFAVGPLDPAHRDATFLDWLIAADHLLSGKTIQSDYFNTVNVHSVAEWLHKLLGVSVEMWHGARPYNYVKYAKVVESAKED